MCRVDNETGDPPKYDVDGEPAISGPYSVCICAGMFMCMCVFPVVKKIAPIYFRFRSAASILSSNSLT